MFEESILENKHENYINTRIICTRKLLFRYKKIIHTRILIYLLN